MLHRVQAPLILFLAATCSVHASWDKANEYKDNECKDGSYTHSGVLEYVTMDDTTHSVYTATLDDSTQKWQAFDDKIGVGGVCSGNWLGDLGGPTKPCTDLDSYFRGKRIKCLYKCSIVESNLMPCFAEE
ncbi:small secreted protein [Seiridium cupressi]